MTESKSALDNDLAEIKPAPALGSDLAKLDATTDEDIARQIAGDSDTAPELTDEQLDEAELYEGDRFVRRVGRPKGSGKKELVTLRIDRDLLDRFRAGGPGWQTRLNATLRSAVEETEKRNVLVGAAEAGSRAENAAEVARQMAETARDQPLQHVQRTRDRAAER